MVGQARLDSGSTRSGKTFLQARPKSPERGLETNGAGLRGHLQIHQKRWQTSRTLRRLFEGILSAFFRSQPESQPTGLDLFFYHSSLS